MRGEHGWEAIQQLSLSTIIKIRPVRTSISRQYASTATVTAPQVEGYVFVAWFSCVTDGWVASVYTADPSNSRTSIWVATHGAYTSGQGDVACYALYAKSKQLSLSLCVPYVTGVKDLDSIPNTFCFFMTDASPAGSPAESGEWFVGLQFRLNDRWMTQALFPIGSTSIYMRAINNGNKYNWIKLGAHQLSLGRFNVHGTAKRFEAYGYTAPDDGRLVFQLVFTDEARKVLGYIEASKKGVTYTDAQLSLDRLDDIVVSSGIGSVGFSWEKLTNEYRLYFHVDGTKVAYLVATFPEQQLSLDRVTFHGVSDVAFFKAENGDMQIRIPGAKSWLCWNETDVFAWKAQVRLPQLGQTTCTSWLLTQTLSLESSVQSNATELPLLIVSISFIWPKES